MDADTEDNRDSEDYGFLDLPFPDEQQGVMLIPWSRNTFRLLDKVIYAQNNDESPLVVLQIWDKDVGSGSFSISLVSFNRYSESWRELYGIDEESRKLGFEIYPDLVDQWNFLGPVGIDTDNPEKFNEAIKFYQKAFSIAMRSLYESEEVNMPDLLCEIEPPMILGEQKATSFSDIGGQSDAVRYLQQFADSEKRGETMVVPGTKRAILFAGPPGNGKSTLAEAFANDLGAPLLRKTTRDLIGSGGDIIKLLSSSILEAKAAAMRTNGKAVLCFEQLEAFLGENLVAHDYFLNTMDEWSKYPEVVLLATSNSPDSLHEGIISRFEVLPILPPNESGIKEILAIQVGKIVQALGNNVFANVDLDRLAKRMTNAIKSWSGRDIAQLLSNTYLLTRRGQLSELNTETLLRMIPDRHSVGFKTS